MPDGAMDSIELRILKGETPIRVTRVHCEGAEIVDEDPAQPLPPLAKLTNEEQVFVVAFLRVHGNIREMERLFNISYPTVKKRLNAIVTKLDALFEAPPAQSPSTVGELLDCVARGELAVEEALETLDEVRQRQT